MTEDRFDAYLAEIAAEAKRAMRLYDLLVIPGAEVTQNHIRSKKNSHIVALNLSEYISADQPAEEILQRDSAAGRVEHRLPSASPDDAADRDQHLLSVGPSEDARRAGGRLGSRQPRRSVLGDQPEALSRTWPTATSTSRSISTRGRRCCKREELGGDRTHAARERGRRADALPQRLLGR